MDEWWNSRDDLVNALELFGDLKGFILRLKTVPFGVTDMAIRNMFVILRGGDFNVNAHFCSI